MDALVDALERLKLIPHLWPVLDPTCHGITPTDQKTLAERVHSMLTRSQLERVRQLVSDVEVDGAPGWELVREQYAYRVMAEVAGGLVSGDEYRMLVQPWRVVTSGLPVEGDDVFGVLADRLAARPVGTGLAITGVVGGGTVYGRQGRDGAIVCQVSSRRRTAWLAWLATPIRVDSGGLVPSAPLWGGVAGVSHDAAPDAAQPCSLAAHPGRGSRWRQRCGRRLGTASGLVSGAARYTRGAAAAAGLEW